jgi:hypothetical protein
MKKPLIPIALLILAGCTRPLPETATVAATPSIEVTVPQATETYPEVPSPSATLAASPTPDNRMAAEEWQEWPVIPAEVSARTTAIYNQGQKLGNNPNAFSKIGDCESTPSWFLGAFDGKTEEYSLGQYSYLQKVIEAFHGSFGRTSLAAGKGFSSANTLTAIWADPKACEKGESPLACEVRVNRPSFALVMLGTNDVYHQDVFERNMRTILDFLIDKGVVPILATKADNLEGDEAINGTIARLAYEYDLPLWNFWRAVQPLPNHGLQEDESHLTWAGPFFDDAQRMKSAWPWRNLTALEALEAVWSGVR